jgi:hypothetical protein
VAAATKKCLKADYTAAFAIKGYAAKSAMLWLRKNT